RVAVRGGNQILAVGQLVLEQRKSHRTDLAGIDRGSALWRGEIRICDGGQAVGGPIAVGQSRRHGNPRQADLLIGSVQVLIADKAEQLVFLEGSAEGAPGGVAMQLWV